MVCSRAMTNSGLADTIGLSISNSGVSEKHVHDLHTYMSEHDPHTYMSEHDLHTYMSEHDLHTYMSEHDPHTYMSEHDLHTYIKVLTVIVMVRVHL